MAFAAYRRGVLLTDLRSPERLVVRGRGRYPLGFTAAGRLVVRHRLGTVGCASGATLRWQGRHLLYGSSDGRLAVLDAARGTRVDLTGLAGRLERPGARPWAAWASDV